MVERIFGTLAVLGALWAAWEAFRAASATKDTAEANLAYVFFTEYFDQDMSEALRTLLDWRRAKGAEFAAEWMRLLGVGDEQAYRVDKARRKVKSYFEKVARLFSARLIRRRLFKEIAYVAGLNVYYDVVDPLGLMLDPGRPPRTLELLLKHCGRYIEGSQIQPVAPQVPKAPPV